MIRRTLSASMFAVDERAPPEPKGRSTGSNVDGRTRVRTENIR